MTEKEKFIQFIKDTMLEIIELLEVSAKKHNDGDSLGFLHRENVFNECYQHLVEHSSKYFQEGELYEPETGKSHTHNIILRCLIAKYTQEI